jgi:hypothetical protein
LPSSHVVPFCLGLATQPPVAALHTPTLHASSSAEQSTAVPVWHCSVCGLQISTPLQGLLSLQSALVLQAQAEELLVQPPSCSEQVSTVQATLSLHTAAAPPHLPAVHLSPVVQLKPSLQVAPSALAGLLHTPVLVLHVPARWQLSSGPHTTWAEGVHEPP